MPENRETEPVVRYLADYENKSKKFLLQNKEFIKQFFGVYTSRLGIVSQR